MARLGMTYGTVIVDLERRQVVDLLADRSAATAADWFKGHPEIELSAAIGWLYGCRASGCTAGAADR